MFFNLSYHLKFKMTTQLAVYYVTAPNNDTAILIS